MDHISQNSFIFKLAPAEIDEVCDDLLLYNEGYNSFYAVDSYDFVHFFFPFIEDIPLNQERMNVLAQDAIAYESFFADSQMGSIVLLNEYKKELLAVRELFFARIRGALELSANIGKVAEEMLQIMQEGEMSAELIDKNYELFFLTLILLQKKETVKEISFLQFLKKKIHVNQIETADEEFNELANRAFNNESEEGFTATIYDDFVDIAYPVLRNLANNRLHRYMENTFNDIEAIRRVMAANNDFHTSEREEKYIFYYLSSAPFKSKALFKCINNRYRQKFEFLDIFRMSGGNIHRNIYQFFLFNEFSQEKSSIISHAIPFLQELKKIVTPKIDAKSNGEGLHGAGRVPIPIKKEIEVELGSLLEKYFLRIENHFYHGLIKNYKHTLEQIIRDGNYVQHELMEEFKKFLSYQEEDPAVTDLGYNLSKFNQVEWLYRAIQKDTDKTYGIKIRFNESDSIRFHFHHLPYLLFVFDQRIHGKYASLYSAMIEISNIDHENINHDAELITFLRKLLRNKVPRVDERLLETLLLTFVDLLAVNVKNEEMPVGDIEGQLIGLLEKQLNMLVSLDKTTLKIKKEKNKNAPVVLLSNEVRYILLHLYRRNGCYHKILEMEAFVNTHETNDPRLYHGIAIGLISRYYYYRHNNKEASDFNRIITYLQKAESGYLDLLEKIQQPDVRNLIRRNVLGVLNSRCNASMVLFQENKQLKDLEDSRFYLSYMKDFFEESGFKYDEFPIVNNTEAWLECYECENYIRTRETLLAKKKFNFASKRAEKSKTKSSFMLPHFKEDLDKKILELKALISKK
jgi:hypothetical protein